MNAVTPAAPLPGFTSKTASVDGVRLHYRVGGDPDAPPVLLWHGVLGTGYTWRTVAPALADAGLAVLVPDMRGDGDSDKPDGTQGYDARARAKEVRALMRQTGVGAGRPLTLVAHDRGAPPALLWAADHPDNVAGLLYMDAPVMLSAVLTTIIADTPEAMKEGSMGWWILSLAPGMPKRLVVGNERAFLTWFCDGAMAKRDAIEPSTVDDYLHTSSGHVSVLRSMGVYRAAFTTMEQRAPLATTKVRAPVTVLGGEKGRGARVREMIALVAATVDGGVIPECGYVVPAERPDEIVRHVLSMTAKTNGRSPHPLVGSRPSPNRPTVATRGVTP